MRSQTDVAAEPVERKLNSSAEQLLDATAALLGERTAMDVSLSDIAARAKLNGALIKYYFGNKNGLLLAVLERDAEESMAALDHLVRMPISAEQKLKIHINGAINAFHRSPYLNRLIHFMIEYGDERSSRRVGEIYVAPIIRAYGAIIAQGVAEGAFRPTEPQFLYYSLIGACEHIFNATYSGEQPLARIKISEETKQAYVAHVTRTFLHGMLAPAAELTAPHARPSGS